MYTFTCTCTMYVQCTSHVYTGTFCLSHNSFFYICTCTCTCTCPYTYVGMYMYMCMYICRYVHVHVHIHTVGVNKKFPYPVRATERPFPFNPRSITVQLPFPFFARSVRSLTQLARESSMRCLRRIQGHRAPTTPKLVEGEGAIASRRGVAKLCSLAKATILWQGKLAVESQRNLVWLTGLLLTSFRAAHNTIALQQNRPRLL